MTLAPIFKGKVTHGKLRIADLENFRQAIKAFEGKDVELILRVRNPQRTLNQNKYFHGCILPLFAESTGHDAEEVKHLLKARFLTVSEDGCERIKSTAELDTDEFTQFLNACRGLGARMGINIPEPEEVEVL